MVNVAVVEDWLFEASVAVKVTVAVPVAPQPSLNPLKLFVQVNPEQVSLATAPPLLANHAFNAAVFPFPSHSTVWLMADTVMVGGVLSTIVIVTVATSQIIGEEAVQIL